MEEVNPLLDVILFLGYAVIMCLGAWIITVRNKRGNR